QLVFYRRRKKGSPRPGPAGRLGCSLCRLLFHSRGGNQASRIGTYDRRWKGRLCDRRIFKTRAAPAASEPELVADQRVWRLRECLKPGTGSATLSSSLCGSSWIEHQESPRFSAG